MRSSLLISRYFSRSIRSISTRSLSTPRRYFSIARQAMCASCKATPKLSSSASNAPLARTTDLRRFFRKLPWSLSSPFASWSFALCTFLAAEALTRLRKDYETHSNLTFLASLSSCQAATAFFSFSMSFRAALIIPSNSSRSPISPSTHYSLLSAAWRRSIGSWIFL